MRYVIFRDTANAANAAQFVTARNEDNTTDIKLDGTNLVENLSPGISDLGNFMCAMQTLQRKLDHAKELHKSRTMGNCKMPLEGVWIAKALLAKITLVESSCNMRMALMTSQLTHILEPLVALLTTTPLHTDVVSIL